MRILTTLGSIICLTFVLSGCTGSSDSASAGNDPNASQGTSNSADPCGSTHFANSDTESRQARMDLCVLVNKARAEAGLEPVTLDPLLNRAAQSHGVDMAENNFASHTGSDGSTADERMQRAGATFGTWGENIAWGFANASTTMQWWMNSAGHKANILSPTFKHLGTGSVETRWVQNFTD